MHCLLWSVPVGTSWKIWERKGRLLGLLFVLVEEEKNSPGGGLRSCRGRVTGKGAIGDAWARQCGRQQSQALCTVVVRVFWRDLAEAGARRGEWLLLDGLRLGTGIVGSGPLLCALFSGTSEQ